MNKSFQRFGAWSGIAVVLIFFAGLITTTFFPPMSPNLTGPAVAALYQSHAIGIRTGGVLIVICSMFCAPFYVAIFLQLKRMEGSRPFGAYSQLTSGAANIPFFALPGILFATAAFRPERSVDSLYALSDLAWIVLTLPWPVGAMQCFCIGVAILTHPEVINVYPRWLGFFNIWIPIGMATSSAVPFFKTGPFAWNGLFAFWIPATAFGLWMLAMCRATLKAIDSDDDAFDYTPSIRRFEH